MPRPLAFRSILLSATVWLAGCDLSELDPPTVPPSLEAPTPSPTLSFVRPTPTPLPTFLVYVVATGDTLTSIAATFGTTAQSVAYWNRATYPSLDPDSSAYDPNTIRIGWTLRLIPNGAVDPEDLPPVATPTPTPATSASPDPS